MLEALYSVLVFQWIGVQSNFIWQCKEFKSFDEVVQGWSKDCNIWTNPDALKEFWFERNEISIPALAVGLAACKTICFLWISCARDWGKTNTLCDEIASRGGRRYSALHTTKVST